jgi:hypothetical protein
VDDPPGTLVGVHPVADLVQRELEQVQVDHVTRVGADLDAVTDFEWAAPDDETPAGQIRHDVFQRNGESRGEEPEVGGQRAGALDPCHPEHQEAEQQGDVRDRLAPLVADPRVLGATVHESEGEPMHQPQPADDEQGPEQPTLQGETQTGILLQPLGHGAG